MISNQCNHKDGSYHIYLDEPPKKTKKVSEKLKEVIKKNDKKDRK